ncbi:MAG: SAM-dependent methyltransferase, partial [Opitutales bacterium]
PWPKKRHHKRRLVQKPFLDLLAEWSVDGAELCMRTGHSEYFEWARESVEEHPSWTIRNEAPWPFEHETFFQKILPDHQSFLATRND